MRRIIFVLVTLAGLFALGGGQAMAAPVSPGIHIGSQATQVDYYWHHHHWHHRHWSHNHWHYWD